MVEWIEDYVKKKKCTLIYMYKDIHGSHPFEMKMDNVTGVFETNKLFAWSGELCLFLMLLTM